MPLARALPARPLLAAVAVLCLGPSAIAEDPGAFFEKEVRPVLTEHCVKCHGPQKQKGGLRLDTRADALKGGDTGPAVVPGKPDDSPLVQAVRFGELQMPPAGKLPASRIEALTKWVKDGAVWPAAADAKPADADHPARKPGTITDADRDWWAFRKVTRPAVPPVNQPGYEVRTPIDAFVADRLIREGLPPTPPADKATLIRRVTFDLTGLPPTPAEVEAFRADDTPDALETVVDRLLASPRYGERQARAWLDLVRYAESDGYRQDAYRPAAWRFRDYVVASFNADKPFDRFVKEQLAGDELFPADPDAKVATGFLRLWQYEYNQRDVRGQWAGILNEVTDVTADVFLGLGMGCARCHDHKFDPILQKDYFALRAFFAGLRVVDEPVHPSAAEEAAYRTRLAAWEAKTADIRAKIDALLEPVRRREMQHAAAKFPADVEAIFAKPAAERTPGEQQLYDLAYRQVELEFERAPTKLKGEQKAEYDRLKKELDAHAKDRPAEPTAMVVRDLWPEAAETVIPGGRKTAVPVEPGFPTVLGGPTPKIDRTATSTGRRAALAHWVASADNPLTARVLVNRVWQQHFGRGLVATPSDFGTLGDKPSHPELLDWLTAEFVANGWSLKKLHRLIVTSAAYQRSSTGAAPPAARTKDPENRLLWRMPVRRLDAEQVRDAMLAVSGELKLDAGGPAVAAAQPRRSIYTRVARNSPDPLLAAFDQADGLSSCATRNVTTTPTQSLLMLNGEATLARAKAFAARVMPADGKNAPAGVEDAFRLAYSRPPTGGEKDEALSFLRQQVAEAGKGPGARLAAWTDFCHALLNSNEFLYAD